MPIAALSGWTSEQKHVVAASFLGWALDAFDFFLMVFVLKDIAKEFDTDVTDVSVADPADTGDAAARRVAVWASGRSLRPPADADGQRAALFGARIRVRLRAEPHGAADPARALRRRHGRRMGRRRLADHGIDPGRRRAASSPDFCRPAIRPAICSPRSSTVCCFSISAGAACSWSACCRRCWCSTSGATCRNRRSGSRRQRAQQHARRAANRTGGSASTRSC